MYGFSDRDVSPAAQPNIVMEDPAVASCLRGSTLIHDLPSLSLAFCYLIKLSSSTLLSSVNGSHEGLIIRLGSPSFPSPLVHRLRNTAELRCTSPEILIYWTLVLNCLLLQTSCINDYSVDSVDQGWFTSVWTSVPNLREYCSTGGRAFKPSSCWCYDPLASDSMDMCVDPELGGTLGDEVGGPALCTNESVVGMCELSNTIPLKEKAAQGLKLVSH
jgi:hypothetical protein